MKKAFEPLAIDEFQGRTRAFVKIEDGCDRFCSYCIIPYARGRVLQAAGRAGNGAAGVGEKKDTSKSCWSALI